MTSRRAARLAAVDTLYAADVRELEEPELAEGCDDYTVALVQGVWARRSAIDAVLGHHATGWDVERMSIVDRNIMRIALWELQEAAVPTAVAIDEAVSIAKRFSGPEAGAFVNGVLDACFRALDHGSDET